MILATRSPWWNLPLKGIGYWSLAYFLLCFPVGVWIISGRRWAYTLLWTLLAAWIFASVSMSFKHRLPSLGFFSIFLAMLSWLELAWLRRELGRSFFDPRMGWFQGLPKSIPGLTCILPGEANSAFVSRLDEDGAFVFVPYSAQTKWNPFKNLQRKKNQNLEFHFRDRKMTCLGQPIVYLNNGTAAGFQFTGLNPDLQTEIGEFVESVRSEGHAEIR